MTAAPWGSHRVLSALREPGTLQQHTGRKWACKACLCQTLLATAPSFLIFISFYFSQTSPSVVAMGTFLALETHSDGTARWPLLVPPPPPTSRHCGQVEPFWKSWRDSPSLRSRGPGGDQQGLRPPFPPPQGWSGVHGRGLGARPASHGPVARCPRVPGRQVHGFARPATRERPYGGDEPSSSLLGALGVPADVCSPTNTGSCSPVWDAALTVAKRSPWGSSDLGGVLVRHLRGWFPTWLACYVRHRLRANDKRTPAQ